MRRARRRRPITPPTTPPIRPPLLEWCSDVSAIAEVEGVVDVDVVGDVVGLLDVVLSTTPSGSVYLVTYPSVSTL